MQTQDHILIVDDEESIRFFLAEELAAAGYNVRTAANGEAALVSLQREPVNLVLLDLKMGGMDGLQVMEAIQALPLPPAVIMLTAYASLESAVEAMRRGGVDYLKKPCAAPDLLASVAAGLQKHREAANRFQMIHLIEQTARQLQQSVARLEPANEHAAIPTTPIIPAAAADPAAAQANLAPSVQPVQPSQSLVLRDLVLDRQQATVMQGQQPLSLTPTEFQLLACLMERANYPVGYCDLAAAIHGQGSQWSEQDARQAVSTHLWRLRHKLGEATDGMPYLINVRGRAYKFIA